MILGDRLGGESGWVNVCEELKGDEWCLVLVCEEGSVGSSNNNGFFCRGRTKVEMFIAVMGLKTEEGGVVMAEKEKGGDLGR